MRTNGHNFACACMTCRSTAQCRSTAPSLSETCRPAFREAVPPTSLSVSFSSQVAHSRADQSRYWWQLHSAPQCTKQTARKSTAGAYASRPLVKQVRKPRPGTLGVKGFRKRVAPGVKALRQEACVFCCLSHIGVAEMTEMRCCVTTLAMLY